MDVCDWEWSYITGKGFPQGSYAQCVTTPEQRNRNALEEDYGSVEPNFGCGFRLREHANDGAEILLLAGRAKHPDRRMRVMNDSRRRRDPKGETSTERTRAQVGRR